MSGTGEEKILHVSRRKFRLGSEIIEGGRFNLAIKSDEVRQSVAEMSAPPPEITDPSDEKLNSVLARSPEDLAILEFVRATADMSQKDEDGCEDLDEQIIQSTLRGSVEEESEDEWETC
jgi:hypothetical protein